MTNQRDTAREPLTNDQRDEIFRAFPKKIKRTAIAAFIFAAEKSLGHYFGGMTEGETRRREHRPTDKQRYPSPAHRPKNVLRLALVSDLFDAYMTTRNDEVDTARGFNKVANAVLHAHGLPLVTKHEIAHLTHERRPFIDLIDSAAHSKPEN